MSHGSRIGTVDDVTEVDQRRLAGLAGFTITTALLVLTVVAWVNNSLAPLGWQGGEYAYAFLSIAVGSLVLGALITVVPRPWRSAGQGMVAGGLLGVVLAIASVMLLAWAFAHSDWQF